MPGSGLHLELTLLHRIGLSPREAIAAATSNFADIYGWRDIGRIEPGRVADVLILVATLVAILQPWTTSIESSSAAPCSIDDPCSKHMTRSRQAEKSGWTMTHEMRIFHYEPTFLPNRLLSVSG